jgi:EAL domain-containing protein (putative c-di-GMP-specific phosphodiesterase class I)
MVTDLGHAIDVTVVAEGVESDNELHALRDIGADQIQGFLFCHPLAPEVLAAWAHERAVADAMSR